MIWHLRHLRQVPRAVATCAVVLILMSTTASSSSVLGQNTVGTPLAGTLPIQATPRGGTPAAGATPIAQALPADATPVPGSARDTETFRAFGYEDVTAHGMHANTVMSFPLPRWSGQSAGGQLDLLYSHSPLLVPELSTMTVSINDRTMTSVRLGKETQDGGRLSISLPAAGSSGDPLVIRFAFHLRLTKDQCAIPDDPALWVTIHDDSRLAFSTKPSATAPYLSDLPTLFTSGPIADEGYPVIVMPERPDGEDFNAAAIVAHQVGNWSGRVLEVPMLGGVSSAEPAGDTPAILIGQGASLPVGGRWGALEWDGEQFLLNGVAVPADAGVLAMRQQPVPQLLVSGGSPDAVRLAAAAIAHVQDGSGYETSALVVSGKLPETTEPREAWEEGAASFAQLGTKTLDVVGPGEHLIEMPFERPASWVLRDGGTLQLLLDVSPGVRMETSWVRVLVNDLDIGSQPLRLSEEGVERYVFMLPAGRLNNDLDGQPVRELSVTLRIFLDYPEVACEAVDPLGTRASLLPTSAWFLPNDTFQGMDIGRFPQGFSGREELPSTGIVIPDHPTEREIQTALQVAAAIGRWEVAGSTAPQIHIAETLSDEHLADRSLILIGGPDRNALTERADSEMLAALHPRAYAADDAETYGVLSLGTSPWDAQRSLLIVADSGEDNVGMLSAAVALGDGDLLRTMQGTGIVVPYALAPQTLVGTDPQNEAPADWAPYVIPDQRPWIERIPAWQVVGAILTITFIGLVVGVVLVRWVRGGTQ